VRAKLLEVAEIDEYLLQLSKDALQLFDEIAKDRKTAILRHPVLFNAFRQFCHEAASRRRVNDLPDLGNILPILMSEVWLRSLEESRGTKIDREEFFKDLIYLASQFNHPEDNSIKDKLPDLYLCYDTTLEVSTAVGVVVNENESLRFLDKCFFHTFRAFSIIETTFEDTARLVLEAAGLV